MLVFTVLKTKNKQLDIAVSLLLFEKEMKDILYWIVLRKLLYFLIL